jgi:hypothetical protein
LQLEISLMKALSIALGSAPYDERCAQFGTPTYPERSVIECRVFRRMLMRRFPLPPNGSAVLTIERSPRGCDFYREVCVGYEGRGGATYALKLEGRGPARWDRIARAELIWHCARRLFTRLVDKGFLREGEVPQAYLDSDPPENVVDLLTDARSFFSPAHAGGPFEHTSVPGATRVSEGDAFGRPDAALILGPIATPHVQGLAVRIQTLRRASIEIAVYACDLSQKLATLSAPLRGGLGADRDEFFVRLPKEDEAPQDDALLSDLFEATGRRLLPAGRRSDWHALWRIKPSVLRAAVDVALPSGLEHRR